MSHNAEEGKNVFAVLVQPHFPVRRPRRPRPHGDAATCQLFGRFFCEMEMDLKSEEERVRAMLFLLTDVGENGPAKRREDWRGRKGLNS